jgi:putative peptide zinc metalloprotease protein
MITQHIECGVRPGAMGADRYLILTAFVGDLTRKARQNPVALTVVVALAFAALLAALTAWPPDGGAYGTVQQNERGAMADTAATSRVAQSAEVLRGGNPGSTVALLPAQAGLPRPEDSQLGMVLMAAASTAEPTEPDALPAALPAEPAAADALPAEPNALPGGETPDGETPEPPWAFPFDRPRAPEEDDNQALAVNTTAGSMTYSAEFALVWAEDGEPVATRNEAYAFANCTDCAAVAVAFQVVLIEDPPDVIGPQNHSAAVNYNCLKCDTHAVASQLVLTVDGGLSDDGVEQLSALWAEIDEYGSNLENVPPSEIQGRLEAYKGQIIAVVQPDPSAAEDGADRAPEAGAPGST